METFPCAKAAPSYWLAEAKREKALMPFTGTAVQDNFDADMDWVDRGRDRGLGISGGGATLSASPATDRAYRHPEATTMPWTRSSGVLAWTIRGQLGQPAGTRTGPWPGPGL
jgi:hypothetical protein